MGDQIVSERHDRLDRDEHDRYDRLNDVVATARLAPENQG
jgi:hypothetical protein